MQIVLAGTIPRPSEKLSSGEMVGPALDALVEQALRRNPLLRFATALEMATQLDRIIGAESAPRVAAWLRDVAGPLLEARSALLTEFESQALPDLGAGTGLRTLQGRPAEAPSQQQPSEFTRPINGAPRTPSDIPATRLGRRVIAAVLLLVGALGLIAYFGARTPSAVPVAGQKSRAAAGTLPAPTPKGQAATQPVGPDRKPSATPEQPTAQTANTPEPLLPAREAPTASPKPIPRKGLVTPPKECSPPYTIDPITGHRKIKRACL